MYALQSAKTRVYIFPPKLTIGRAGRDLNIPDSTVSRQHAEIIWESAGSLDDLRGPRLVLKDESKFGSTKLNNRDVPRDPITGERRVPLEPGDVLKFGTSEDEFTVVADRLTFMAETTTNCISEIRKFADKTGHRIVTTFDPTAVAFIHDGDFVTTDSASPLCLMAAVYGIPVIAVEYLKQFASLKSGTSESVLPMEKFELMPTQTRDKCLAGYSLVFSSPSRYSEAFKLAGVIPNSSRVIYVGYEDAEIRECTTNRETYSATEADLIQLILEGAQMSDSFRIYSRSSPDYFQASPADEPEPVRTENTSGWISPLNSKPKGEMTNLHSKVVAMSMPHQVSEPTKTQESRPRIKRPIEEIEQITLKTWRSNRQLPSASDLKTGFDDFFAGKQVKRPGFRL